MIVGTAAKARDQCTGSSFSASALFSERLRGAACSVKRDIIASLILHANIAKITAQELSLSCLILSCVYYMISSDNGSIKLYIWIFVQTSFLEAYVFLKGCVSVII